VRFVGPALKAVMQNYGDFMDIILLYYLQCDYEHLYFTYSVYLYFLRDFHNKCTTMTHLPLL